ncbi:MAG TPA: hypothetical protein VHG09_14020 [Longimicrobiales bacterium]|nr:hypothetical protein [Longimicrobiales bacterium]
MHLKLNHIALPLTFAALAACAPDVGLTPSDRPMTPPAAAFDPDLSFFDGRTPGEEGGTTAWGQALQTVAKARADMEMLQVPEALLRAASSVEGTRDGSSWRWPFSTTVDGDPYDGELRSSIIGEQYEWLLYVEAPDHSPPLTDYIWAQGRTGSGNFDGIWWLADAEAGTDTIAAAVSWALNLENKVNFTFAASDTSGWQYEPSSNINVLTRVAFDQPRARVTWNALTGEGSTWVAGLTTACWDEDLNDIVC